FGAFRVYGQYNYKIKSTYDESSFQGYEEKTEISAHELLIGADWTPSLNENLKLAVGPYLGYARFSFEESDGVDSDSGNLNGFVFGGKVGAIFDTGVGEFEAGVKADKTWLKAKEDGIANQDKTTVGLYLGYNFKF
ncbi:MAG: hypothetical protein J6W17_04720, partial [Campylobacter sp.]|nr:hypothetical protein [Campylobacter sp.]